MIFKEYGSLDNKTVILLHGGGLSWWNYREVAEHLQDEYHIIIPVSASSKDAPFFLIVRPRPCFFRTA